MVLKRRYNILANKSCISFDLTSMTSFLSFPCNQTIVFPMNFFSFSQKKFLNGEQFLLPQTQIFALHIQQRKNNNNKKSKHSSLEIKFKFF